jgi:NAD-dependent deacetylase
MHGVLSGAFCDACAHRWDAPMAMAPDDACPACTAPATRPDVVWFGEIPYHLDAIAGHLETCTLFAAIGTSGQVHPAAGFVQEARAAGAETVELNRERTDISHAFDSQRIGPASETVPAWVASLLA